MIFNVKCILVLTVVNSFFLVEATLQQLHVVFRHGDRNPEKLSMYPTDPNINDTWAPDGFGQLTMFGKIQEYSLGEALRQRYNKFLGDIYTSNLIDAISTDQDRTKMSLELVLAGLFPPGPTQMWNEMLPWQPIPYSYVPLKGDSMMRFSMFCPKFRALFDKVQSSGHFQKFWDSNIELIEYISKNSGVNISNYLDLGGIFDILYTETKTFRKIPKWTRKVFPEFLTEVTNLYYEILTYTDEMNKLSGGSLLKKIIDDMEAKKSKTLSPKERKIFLYSGHEFNVAYILGALKVFKPRMPPYGSYVVIELHKVGEIFGVKIFYQDYSQVKPKYLIIPGCDVFCPFNQFVTLTKSVIPNNDDFLCYKQ